MMEQYGQWIRVSPWAMEHEPKTMSLAIASLKSELREYLVGVDESSWQGYQIPPDPTCFPGAEKLTGAEIAALDSEARYAYHESTWYTAGVKVMAESVKEKGHLNIANIPRGHLTDV